MSMKRIVITGGTYAGKSSITELFKQDGFSVVPDVGLEIIKQLNNELGQEEQKQFRANQPLKFYSKIIKKKVEYEGGLSNKPTIFDRGIYDYIAMMKLKEIQVPPSLMQSVKKVSYDIVFVLDTLSDFSMRPTSGRSLSKEDSLKLKKLVTEIYEKLGCKIVLVKEMPLKERYEFIKKHL